MSEQNAFTRGSVRAKRWTRDDLRRFRELGLIDPQERIELIGGEIYEKMGMNPPHASKLRKLIEYFLRQLPETMTAQSRLPVVLSDDTETEPDIAVLRGTSDRYDSMHPTQNDTLLVIEISDSTLQFDRGRKAASYAQAQVADYWIVNIQERCVEVYRNPHVAPENPWGFAYNAPQVFGDGDTVAALNVPLVVPVAVLLPPPPP